MNFTKKIVLAVISLITTFAGVSAAQPLPELNAIQNAQVINVFLSDITFELAKETAHRGMFYLKDTNVLDVNEVKECLKATKPARYGRGGSFTGLDDYTIETVVFRNQLKQATSSFKSSVIRLITATNTNGLPKFELTGSFEGSYEQACAHLLFYVMQRVMCCNQQAVAAFKTIYAEEADVLKQEMFAGLDMIPAAWQQRYAKRLLHLLHHRGLECQDAKPPRLVVPVQGQQRVEISPKVLGIVKARGRLWGMAASGTALSAVVAATQWYMILNPIGNEIPIAYIPALVSSAVALAGAVFMHVVR